MDKYIQGQSIDRRILLNDNGIAIDTGIFLTIEVLVRRVCGNYDGGTYTKAAGTLTQESPTTDGYVFYDIPPATSLTMKPGVWLQQLTTTETDANYDGGVRTRTQTGGQFRVIKKRT